MKANGTRRTPIEPTVEAITKSRIVWAYVAFQRPARRSSRRHEHEVEETWRDCHIRGRGSIRGVADGGFKATDNGQHSSMVDSPLRKTCHYELHQLYSGTVPHPLRGLDATTDFNELLSAGRSRFLVGWPRWRSSPCWLIHIATSGMVDDDVKKARKVRATLLISQPAGIKDALRPG